MPLTKQGTRSLIGPIVYGSKFKSFLLISAMPTEVSVQPQDSKEEGNDVKNLKATRQGILPPLRISPLLKTFFLVEFYFADSNLPYDK